MVQLHLLCGLFLQFREWLGSCGHAQGQNRTVKKSEVNEMSERNLSVIDNPCEGDRCKGIE